MGKAKIFSNVEPDVFPLAVALKKLCMSKAFFYKELRLERIDSILRSGTTRMVTQAAIDKYLAMCEAEGRNPDGSPVLGGQWKK